MTLQDRIAARRAPNDCPHDGAVSCGECVDFTARPEAVLDDAETLESAVFQALGAASACWEVLEGAGVFDSTRCRAIGDELLERIAGDRAHLLAEHRAATAELRRLRTANAELEQRAAELERENDLYVERIDELEAELAEVIAR